MRLVLLVLLILVLFGGLGVGPWWPHSADWGYYPMGGAGMLLLIIVLLLLLF